jgi:ribosomal protein S21
MALEIRKQEKENSQSLIRRFSKSVKLSGILLEARKRRFTERGKSRQMKKRSALRREQLKMEYKKLEKLGKISSFKPSDIS